MLGSVSGYICNLDSNTDLIWMMIHAPVLSFLFYRYTWSVMNISFMWLKMVVRPGREVVWLLTQAGPSQLMSSSSSTQSPSLRTMWPSSLTRDRSVLVFCDCTWPYSVWLIFVDFRCELLFIIRSKWQVVNCFIFFGWKKLHDGVLYYFCCRILHYLCW